ncbi:MAG: HIT family protein [Bacteroidia bacterium]|jgi:histidine triad (HIT) family protein|nr:HIT family protein [Bacteroidia bacterium]
MASIFTRIVNGEIPSHKVAETANCLAFLDVFPLAQGHVLVIPKQETDLIFDLDTELYSELHLFAREVAKAVKKVIPCRKVGMAVIGLEVPHAHIHLVPLNEINDINFTREKLKPSPEELAETARKISEAFLAG